MIARDTVLQTPRCLLRAPELADTRTSFRQLAFVGFNDGMLWEPPATIEESAWPPSEKSGSLGRRRSLHLYGGDVKPTGFRWSHQYQED